MGDEASPMVRVVDAYKSLGQTIVLNGFNMTVPTGKIYALLGPSGCGKTVLLNCIVGLRSLDNGHIRLKITKRTEFGYMPQDVGLSADFTVRETLEFYGRIYDISEKDLNVKIEELATLLELPDMNAQIKQLSGGEQRRVSLSITLLHSPKLLLLDEPTVGVDPLLSHNIWIYLEQAARSGVTVIITTHYVEEARMANLVGMMRGGELLVEESPTELMSRHGVFTLENAFLQLSRQHQLDLMERKKGPLLGRKRRSERQDEIFEPGEVFRRNRFYAQTIKNYIMMKRNYTMICLMLLLPFTLSILQTEAYSHLPKMSIALVADELNPDEGGESLCERSRSNFKTEEFNCTSSAPFTCLLLDSLKKSIDTVIYNDDNEARSAVLANKVWGMLHIPSNFTHTLSRLVLYGTSYLGTKETDELLEMVTIDAHLDASNFIMDQWLKKKLNERYQFFIKSLAVSCGLPETYAATPLRVMPPIHGHIDPILTETIVPAFLGVTYLETVAAHMIAQTVFVSVQKTIMLVILYVFYEETLLGSKTLAVTVLFAIEAVGVAYGFFITEVCTSERAITYLAISSLNLIFLISGIVWPMEGAHAIMKSVLWAVPVGPAIKAYKTVALRGQGLENAIVVKGLVSCVVWISIFSLGTCLSHRAKRSTRN